MGDLRINNNLHTDRPTVSGIKELPDGTRYREYQMPEMVIQGTAIGADYLTELARQNRPLDVIIDIDSTDSMKHANFMILAQLHRLVELCRVVGVQLNVEIAHFHDGREFVQLPLTAATDGGLARIVEAILTIPYGNNYGGVTIGDAATAVLKRHPADSQKRGGVLIVFANNASLTDREVGQIGLVQGAGYLVAVTNEIMAFLPNDKGRVMSRPEAVRRVAELLKIYGQYEGNGGLARRFETEKSFLLKLSYAIALDSSGNNPADVGHSIMWDPRFRCTDEKNEGLLCLEAYSDWPSGVEAFISGLNVYWTGSENYYSFLYQLAREYEGDSYVRTMGVLIYDMLKTVINDSGEYNYRWHIPVGKIKESSKVSDLKFMLDYFSVDPWILIYTIKTFNKGELLGYFFDNCDDQYAFLKYFDLAVEPFFGQPLPRPLSGGTPFIKGVKDKIAAHLSRQFKLHDEAWRFEQADRIAKMCEIVINMRSARDVEFFIFLVKNVPGLKESQVVRKKVSEFLDYCMDLMKDGESVEDEVGNIYVMLAEADMIPDERKRELSRAYLKYEEPDAYPKKNGYFVFMLTLTLDPADIERLLKDSNLHIIDIAHLMKNTMDPDQKRNIFDRLSVDWKRVLLEKYTALFFEACRTHTNKEVIEIILEIVDDADNPLRVIDALFKVYAGTAGGEALIVGEVFKRLEGYRWKWGRDERHLFEVADALAGGDAAGAVKIVHEKMLPRSPDKYLWYGWDWYDDVYTMSGGGEEGMLFLKRVRELRENPLTWAGMWLVRSKDREAVIDATTNYLMSGNPVQRGMAHDMLLNSALVKKEDSLARIIEGLRVRYDPFLAGFLGGRLRIGINERDSISLAEVLIGYFEPERFFANTEQQRINHILNLLGGSLSNISMEKKIELFKKIQRLITVKIRNNGIFMPMRVLNSLGLPLGKKREAGDVFLKDYFLAAVAEWVAESRVTSFDISPLVRDYLKSAGLSADEYVIIMDVIFERYFRDVNTRPMVNIILGAFSDQYPEEFYSYLVGALKSEIYDPSFKGMVYSYYFRGVASATTTAKNVEKIYNKETGQVEQTSSISFECQDKDKDSCAAMYRVYEGSYKIVADKGIPLDYRITSLKNLYYIAIKYDPKVIALDLAVLCGQLIADPETKKIGEYYLKKWQDFRVEMEGQK